MSRMHDDKAQCSGRYPDAKSLPCPMRWQCHRHRAFAETSARDEPHQVFVMMPPRTAYARAGEPIIGSWHCPQFLEVEEETA